jgi:hypothetical protein
MQNHQMHVRIQDLRIELVALGKDTKTGELGPSALGRVRVLLWC